MAAEDAETQLQRPTKTALRSEVDPLLEHVFALDGGGTLAKFGGGLTVPLRSVKFLMKNRPLWGSVAIPALINMVLFVIVAGVLIWQSSGLMDMIWSRPDEGAWWYVLALIAWWALRVILIPLLIIVSYFITMILGGLIASPFNDALSEKTEAILTGRELETEEGFWPMVRGGVRGATTAGLTVAVYLAVMSPIVLLNLIPGVGSVAATILGGIVSAFFLSLEYTDSALDRKGYRFKHKIKKVWEHRKVTGGFGLGTAILLWVPLLNFLCMPLAVIGGTAVGLGIDEFEDEPDDVSRG